MADPAPAPAAGEAPPAAAAAAAAAAADEPPAEACEASKQRRNRIKKLKAQYVAILELEQRAAAGQPLDAGQAEKVSRKAAVAEELESLGVALPEAPPPPLADVSGHSAAWQAIEEDITQEEVAAALEKLVGGGGGGQRRRPQGPISRALSYQYKLLEENPGFRWVLGMGGCW